MATVLHVALQAMRDCNTLLTPFLPHSAQQVHELLGGTGVWSGLPEVQRGVRGGQRRLPGDPGRLRGRRRAVGEHPDRRRARRCPHRPSSSASSTRRSWTRSWPAWRPRPAREPAIVRRRPSRSGCRSPTATATSTSSVTPDDEAAPSRTHSRAAAAAGVPRIVQIGCDLPGAAVGGGDGHRARRRSSRASPCTPTRHRGSRRPATLADALAEIDALAADPRVRAVGETGLDHFRTGPEGRGVQEASFRAHIEMAKRHGKALVIHDRDAHDDVLRVLAEEGAPERVVFHCFSGDGEMAEHCVRRGWWLSFAGTVTFKNAGRCATRSPSRRLDRLLVETDAPFLTPMPYRGRPTRRTSSRSRARDGRRARSVARTSWRRRSPPTPTAAFDPW